MLYYARFIEYVFVKKKLSLGKVHLPRKMNKKKLNTLIEQVHVP